MSLIFLNYYMYYIQVVVFSYGNGNKNLMDDVKLYEKVKSEFKDEEKKVFFNIFVNVLVV